MTDILRQRKVLIVDDGENWRDTLAGLYRDEGIEVVAVGSLDEAKKALDAGGFTDVLTDGLDGEWTGVVDSAQGLPVRLFSGTVGYKKEAQLRGVPFLDKEKLNIDEVIRDPRKV